MFLTFSLQLILLLSILIDFYHQHVSPLTPHWDYQRDGPDTWHRKFVTCESKIQSPINIRTSHVIYDPTLSPLVLNDFVTNTSYVWNFTHNGHTIAVYPTAFVRFSISGAGLPDKFDLIQFHFHWGYNAYQGSEHTIDGIKYPLEIHFVHQARSSDALAVVSVLFQLQSNDNPYINDLLLILNQTSMKSMFVETQIDISYLFPTFFSPQFYRYNGSLTTPPCTDGIHWIVLASTVPISEDQLKVFANNAVPLNFRQPQKLYKRKVLANFQPQNLQKIDDEDNCRSSVCTQELSRFLLLFTLILTLFLLNQTREYN